MRTVIRSRQFRRDIERAEQRGKDLTKMRDLLLMLIAGQPLSQQYKDHPLKGVWKGYRDAHIAPDWLVIYRVSGNELQLVRTGTHADLFG